MSHQSQGNDCTEGCQGGTGHGDRSDLAIPRQHGPLGVEEAAPEQQIGAGRIGREVAREQGPVRPGIEGEGEAREAGRAGEGGRERSRPAQGAPAPHREGQSEETGEGEAHVHGRAHHEIEEVLPHGRGRGRLGGESVGQQGPKVDPAPESGGGEAQRAETCRPHGGAKGQSSGAPGEDHAERRHEPRLRMDEEGERPEHGQPAKLVALRQDHQGRHQSGEQGGLHPQQGEAHQLGVEGRGQHGEGCDPRGDSGGQCRRGREGQCGREQGHAGHLRRERRAEHGGERGQEEEPARVGDALDACRRVEREAVAGEKVRDVMETYVGIVHEQAAVAPGGREEPGGRERGGQPARPRFSRTRGFLTFQMMPSTM